MKWALVWCVEAANTELAFPKLALFSIVNFLFLFWCMDTPIPSQKAKTFSFLSLFFFSLIELITPFLLVQDMDMTVFSWIYLTFQTTSALIYTEVLFFYFLHFYHTFTYKNRYLYNQNCLWRGRKTYTLGHIVSFKQIY